MTSNRVFCTFTKCEDLGPCLETIGRFVQQSSSALSKRVFLLYIEDNDEVAVTYQMDKRFPSLYRTVLVHRKKDSNTLYTINALNLVIKEQNNGILDKNFSVNWNEYKNSILLTRGFELNRIKTRLYKIIEF